MSLLTCPLCGREQDAAGPGVVSWRVAPDEPWSSRWVPIIEDLRGSPQRLVHPRCFADAAGRDALIALIRDLDKDTQRHVNGLGT